MKGKIGLVVGLGAGYVLGTRAGRERYEQIKTQWLKVWNLDPVQEQVSKVSGFVGDKAAAVPGAVWTGVVKVAKTVTGSGTPGQRLDSAIATSREVAEDLEEATEEAVEAAKAAGSSNSTAKKPAAKKSTSTKTSSANTTANKTAPKKSGV